MDRRSSLLVHLGKAQSKISSLEDYIREREKQFRAAVSRFERSDSRSTVMGGGSRLRRAGLSHNLLHMRTASQEEEEQEEMDLYSRPLANFSCLKIVRVLPPPDSDEAPPFSLQRLLSREYHVGEDGLLIGRGEECGVTVPLEAALKDKHVEIKWVPAVTRSQEGSVQHSSGECGGGEHGGGRRGSRLTRQEVVGSDAKHSGHFEVHDLTGGKGAGFYVSHDPVSLQHLTIMEQEANDEPTTTADKATPTDTPSDTPTSAAEHASSPATITGNQLASVQAYHGIRFVAGNLEFSLTALSTEVLYTLRMFAATKKGDLSELTHIVESSKTSGLVVPYIVVSPQEDTNAKRFSTISVASNQGVDVNVQYQPPAYSDDMFYGQSFNRRRSSAHVVRAVTLLPPQSPVLASQAPGGGVGSGCLSEEHQLLLHIAIDKGYLEIVTYLLSQNADVNLCVGELSRSALHLAAQKNLPDVTLELLRFGGDVEVRDALHLQPLALTTDYRVRKLLVNTVLLCAASEEGDFGEVVRLLSSTQVSPNARGLRHKNALHLAAAKGHRKTAEFLLLNRADVNSKGGTRLRTPLHYASLNDHIEVAKLLLEAGANEFSRDSGGYTPLNLSMGGKMCKLLYKEPLSLCLAVQSGDVEPVKSLLVALEGGREEGGGCDTERTVDQRNEQSHAPLHLACTSGNVEMVQVLVAHGASIDLRGGSDSWTPLMYAAMAGHREVVEFLISVGADSEEMDERGCVVGERVEQALEETKDLLHQLESRMHNQAVTDTALHTLEPASMLRQESGSSFSPEAERAWVKNRYDKLQKTLRVLTSGPDRMLKCIEAKNHAEFVELLKSGVVGVNAIIDKHSPSSALVRVCENGLYKFAKTLIEYGVQVNPIGPADQIPLLVAADDGNMDVVKLLHESGADINVQSEDTLATPLHEAATANSIVCVAYLLSVGAKQDVINSSGETPFDCSRQHEVKTMLAIGPNKLLLAASIGDCQEIERLIKDEGLSPSHVYPRGVTALHEACEAGHTEAAKLLIDNGADVNKQVHASMVTPLHLASQCNSIEIARLLIAAGAKLGLKDMDGKVPFEVAFSNPMRKVLVEARTVHTQPVPREENSTTERRCMICMDNPINTIILPCGHEAFCTNCVSRITVCALDRQAIREVITVFK